MVFPAAATNPKFLSSRIARYTWICDKILIIGKNWHESHIDGIRFCWSYFMLCKIRFEGLPFKSPSMQFCQNSIETYFDRFKTQFFSRIIQHHKTETIRFNLHSLVFLLKETVFEIGSLRIQKRNLGHKDAMIITIWKTNLSVL